MGKIASKRLSLVLGVLSLLLVLVILQWPDQNLRLVFCDVGQGDGMIMSLGSYQVLVDGGPDNKILACLGDSMPFWDRTIEAVVLTHPQADHMTGLVEVIRRHKVEKFLVSNTVNDTALFWQLREEVVSRGVEVVEVVAGDRVKIGKLDLEVLWPNIKGVNSLAWTKTKGSREMVLGESQLADSNEITTVLLGRFGQFDWILTGDIGKKQERAILDDLKRVEVLKVGHHGSKYSSGREFIDRLSPQVGVISVGKNRFGHPTKEVLDRLKKVGAKVLRTDELGKVVVVSDGKSWWIED